MDSLDLEIGEVRTSYQGGNVSGPRAEQISRLTFERLQEMIDRDMNGLSRDRTVEYLNVPPIEISLDGMADEAIAQMSAEAVFRALLTAI